MLVNTEGLSATNVIVGPDGVVVTSQEDNFMASQAVCAVKSSGRASVCSGISGSTGGGSRKGEKKRRGPKSDASVESVAITVEAVKAMVSRTVGSDCDIDVLLVEVGLDSLGAVELTNLVQGALGHWPEPHRICGRNA